MNIASLPVAPEMELRRALWDQADRHFAFEIPNDVAVQEEPFDEILFCAGAGLNVRLKITSDISKQEYAGGTRYLFSGRLAMDDGAA